MNHRKAVSAGLLVAVLLSFASTAIGAPPRAEQKSGADDDLFTTVAKLDTAFFDSFNHCAQPEELAKHASFLDEHLEFYHDKAGLQTKDQYLEKTRANVCGHFKRVLVTGSLRVVPIAGYGAIETGRHLFCYIQAGQSGKCFGNGRFTAIWQRSDAGWKLTRALSYDHQDTH